MYAATLASEGVLSTSDSAQIHASYMAYLNEELSKSSNYRSEERFFDKQWSGLQLAPAAITYWDTGLDFGLLNFIGKKSVEIKDGFVSILRVDAKIRIRD